MADVKGGYHRPVVNPYISDSRQGHINRTPPSREPGTDYGCAYGSQLTAPEDGVILYVKHDTNGPTGRLIKLGFNDGQSARFLHLKNVEVGPGGKVKRGQHMGYTGASANGREWGVGAHVHVTLLPTHADDFSRTLDFATQVGPDNDYVQGPIGKYSQVVADRQNFLNAWRGEKLVVDGLLGNSTKAAIKRYQSFLKVAADGEWGRKTQAAHQKYYDLLHKGFTSAYPVLTFDNIADGVDVRGFQKIANLYLPHGRKTAIDGKWGLLSREGFGNFLRQNWGGSAEAWLRARYGYVGDNRKGPVMTAALNRASAANLRELK
jgi:hypothetical protein